MSILVLLFAVVTPTISFAKVQKFKYFQLDIPDGWVADESSDGLELSVEPEDQTSSRFVVSIVNTTGAEGLARLLEKMAKKEGWVLKKIADGKYRITIDSIDAKKMVIEGVYKKNNVSTLIFLRDPDDDVLLMKNTWSMHTMPDFREPVQTARSQYNCTSVSGNFDAYNACTGNCTGVNALRNPEAYEACRGNCVNPGNNFGAYEACRGNCSNLGSSARSACESCGGGSKWAAMYLLGATVSCFR
jgi:hypothetical protein